MMKIRNLVLLLIIVPTPAASQVAVELVSRDEMLTPTASIIALERSRRALLEARLAIDDALSEVDETLALLRAIEARRSYPPVESVAKQPSTGLVHAVDGRVEAQPPVPRNSFAGARDFVGGFLDALDLGHAVRDLLLAIERRLSAGAETVQPVLDRIRFAALRVRRKQDAAPDESSSRLTPCRSPEGTGQGVVAPFTAFDAPPSGHKALEVREASGRESSLSPTAAPTLLPGVPSLLLSDPTEEEAIVRYTLPDALQGAEEARAPLEPTLPAVERHLETLAPSEQ